MQIILLLLSLVLANQVHFTNLAKYGFPPGSISRVDANHWEKHVTLSLVGDQLTATSQGRGLLYIHSNRENDQKYPPISERSFNEAGDEKKIPLPLTFQGTKSIKVEGEDFILLLLPLHHQPRAIDGVQPRDLYGALLMTDDYSTAKEVAGLIGTFVKHHPVLQKQVPARDPNASFVKGLFQYFGYNPKMENGYAILAMMIGEGEKIGDSRGCSAHIVNDRVLINENQEWSVPQKTMKEAEGKKEEEENGEGKVERKEEEREEEEDEQPIEMEDETSRLVKMKVDRELDRQLKVDEAFARLLAMGNANYSGHGFEESDDDEVEAGDDHDDGGFADPEDNENNKRKRDNGGLRPRKRQRHY